MSTKFLSPGWRMPRNANQSKQSNYSMDFDGANDYIDTGFIPADKISGNFTISAYVDCGNIGGGIGVDFICGVQNYGTTGKRFGFGVYDNNAPKYYYMFGSLGAISFTISNNPKNGWTHLAVTYDGTNLRFYSNGTLDGTTNVGALSALPTSNMYIGARNKVNPNDDAVDFFDGKMEQVCIFDYALSLSQVTTLYGDSTNGPGNPMALPSSPIAYYPLGTSAWNGEYLAENNAIGDYVFDFPIAEQSVNISNNFENYTEMSLSTWVNFNNFSGYQYVFSTAAPNNGAGTQFAIAANPSSGVIYSYDGANLNSTGVSVALNTWNHILVTQTGTTRKVFINGQQAGSDITTSALNLNQGTAFIGKYHTAGYSANAKISNVQIFNTALSATDVETLYNYGSPIQTLANIPQSSSLKAWYKLDATEIYNSTSTEWSVDNNQNPSAYPSSLNFNRATTDSISLGSSSSIRPTGDYTFSIWYNLSSSANAGVWCAATSINSSGLALFKGNSGGLELYHKGTSSTSAVVFLGSASGTLNIWQNAIFTYDDTSRVIKGYLNGNLISTVSVAGTGSVSWANNFYLGRLIQNGNYYLGGRLSNFQIFNTKLEEIGSNSVETLYNSGNPLTDMSSFSSLVSWWKLNNTTTGIQDSKGSNNGTNNGATEYAGFVNTLAGDSSGMSQSNLIQSDLQTVAPYSKYALAFDGTNDYIQTGGFTIGNNYTFSCWLKSNTTSPSNMCFLSSPNYYSVGYDGNFVIRFTNATQIQMYSYNERSDSESSTVTIPSIDTNWHHFSLTSNATTTNIYWDGSPLTVTGNQTKSLDNISQGLIIGDNITGNNNAFNGSISNVSIWNAALTSAQVREIYNEGLPSDLNTFSGAAPVAWWQLGSNSSWNGNRWIVADEIGSNNGYSQNMSPYMPESGLTNGVGTTANGVSDNMSEGSLVGDAPYSTANALSSGMAVTARGTDVPS